MRKQIFFAFSFFITAPLLILLIIFYTLYHQYELNRTLNPGKQTLSSADISYEAVPEKKPEAVLGVEARDARIEVLEEFFVRYNSPLKGQGELIVSLADEYGLDYRMIPAIAFKESTLCHKIPHNSFNCWGYGIYGKKVTRFQNYEEGIETVTRGLAKNYIAQGYTSPEEIMSKYTPSSNGSWAETVNLIMNRIHESL